MASPTPPRAQKPAIGIDLGTTFSCVAVFQEGKVEVIANSQGHRITPSVVAFTERGRIIGEGAEIQQSLDPRNTVFNAKRFIGRKWDDHAVQDNIERYPFKIQEQENRVQFGVTVNKKQQFHTPEEVSGAVLLRLKKIAEDYLDTTVEDAVITVPAYFTDSQRQATKDAGRLAGLNVLRIINEPTAAAMAYGLQEDDKKEEGKHILVYDLGGGTFDVSVLEIEGDLLQVKATSGKTDLGGEDFNSVLVKHFKKEIFRKHRVDMSPNHKAIQRLTNACEILKRNLSSENTTQSKIDLDAFLPDGKDFSSSMSRAQFEHLCQPHFNETMKYVDLVLQDSGLSKDDISEVVLVGGSSRIPKIQAMLSEFFNHKTLNKSVNPDEAVACGAAIQAAILNNNQHTSVKDLLLMDVNPLSLGTSRYGGITDIIIQRNTMIPVKRHTVRQTAKDFQTSVVFDVIEGERAITAENHILGSFTMSDIPAAPRGQEKFDLVYELDANGILSVTATHQRTAKEQGITLDASTSGRLTAKEINSLVEKAETMKMRDELEENRCIAKNKLEGLCSQIRLETRPNLGSPKVKELLTRVDNVLQWVEKHPNAAEQHMVPQYDTLASEASKILLKVVKDKTSRRSDHVFRMSQMTAKFCLQSGNLLIESTTEKDLEEALIWFRKACDFAREKGQMDRMVIASQRIGHTLSKLIMMSKDMTTTADRCIRAAFRLADAMNFGKRNRVLGKETEQSIIKDMQLVADEFFKALIEIDENDKAVDVSNFMHAFTISKAVKSTPWDRIRFSCCVRQIELYLEKIEAALQTEDFKSALFILSELAYPREEALRVMDSDTESEQLFEVKKEEDAASRLANGLKFISQAEETMDKAQDASGDGVDRALLVLDLLSQAKDLTKHHDMKVFCKAKVYEGKVFHKLLMNKARAKACFKEVLDISLSQQYTNTIWYKEANAIFQKIQSEENSKEEPDLERKMYIKQLNFELKQLEAAAHNTDEDFLDFLFSTFPPVHRENCKKPAVSQGPGMKKVYIKLSMYYHPDKVDTTVHGRKYQVLCEEIAKVVNARYANMKALE